MPNLPKAHRPPQPKARLLARKRREQSKRLYRTNHPTWRRLRAEQLRQEPLCRECKKEGRITAGNEVDHIDGDTYNNSQENLQTLCKKCHSRKTARECGFVKAQA